MKNPVVLPRSSKRAASNGKTEPTSKVKEHGVLSCLLLASSESPELIDKLLAKLTGDHFHDLKNRDLLNVIREMRRSGLTVNLSTLRDELTSRDQLHAVGGIEFLRALEEHAPGVSMFDDYFKELEEMRQRRQFIEDARQMDKQARNFDVPITDLVAIARASAQKLTEGSTVKRRIVFRRPSEIRAFQPPNDWRLVGNHHMDKGGVSVIAGPPGIGKSRAITELARRGAEGCGVWLGLTIHCKFRTLIIQNENGLARLKEEYDAITDDLDEWVRVSEPPSSGMAFDNADFQRDVAAEIEEFRPHLIFVDPWNSVARDDGQRDYKEAWTAIQSVMPTGEHAAHLSIAAHCRKPRDNERLHGRALLNTVAGHHILISVPRSVFVMEPVTDDPEDNRIVWTNVKNNDGQMTPRSAWMRTNSGFDRCDDFDWNELDEPKGERVQITYEHMDELFEEGKRYPSKKTAVEALIEMTKCQQSTAYSALKSDGRFAKHLSTSRSGLLVWKP